MSSETPLKCSPGPWKVYRPRCSFERVGIEGADHAIVVFGTEDDQCGVHGWHPAEAEANAHMFAASPKLYEALADLAEWHEWSLEQSERAADEFYRETGMLAPFKDMAAACGGDERLARQNAWRDWYAARNAALIAAARTALASARGEG